MKIKTYTSVMIMNANTKFSFNIGYVEVFKATEIFCPVFSLESKIPKIDNFLYLYAIFHILSVIILQELE